MLDEPFHFVDADAKESLWQTIQERFRNSTLLIVSHDALPWSAFDRVLRLTENGLEQLSPGPDEGVRRGA